MQEFFFFFLAQYVDKSADPAEKEGLLVLLKLGLQQSTGPRMNFVLAEFSGVQDISQDRAHRK